MSIYVQSRGREAEYDYRWLKVGDRGELIPEIPPLLSQPIATAAGTPMKATEAIESHKPSLVLARVRGELLLWVTGLPAGEERMDFMGRRVRNSIAWIETDTAETDARLRSLAVRVLREELAPDVDTAVRSSGEFGFTVAPEAIAALSASPCRENLAPIRDRMLGGNTPQLRTSLASELERHTLPKTEGFLVVISGIKSRESLQAMGVWRGLSNRIAESEWITLGDREEAAEPANFFGGVAAIAAGIAGVAGLLMLLLG